MDPLAADYPWYTPYQFAGNKPIWTVDLDGLEELFYTENFAKSELGESVINISSQTSLMKEFNRSLKSQTKYDIYAATFNSTISDYDGTIKSLKLSSEGHISSGRFPQGFMFRVDNEADFNDLRKTSFTFNSVEGLDAEKLNEAFSSGKGVLFLLVADQMMNPSKNKANSNSSNDRFKLNVLRNSTNTYVHEAWSHALPFLKNNLYKQDINTEHFKFHGGKTFGSPGVEDYDMSPSRFLNTKFGNNMVEIDKIIKNENK